MLWFINLTLASVLFCSVKLTNQMTKRNLINNIPGINQVFSSPSNQENRHRVIHVHVPRHESRLRQCLRIHHQQNRMNNAPTNMISGYRLEHIIDQNGKIVRLLDPIIYEFRTNDAEIKLEKNNQIDEEESVMEEGNEITEENNDGGVINNNNHYEETKDDIDETNDNGENNGNYDELNSRDEISKRFESNNLKPNLEAASNRRSGTKPVQKPNMERKPNQQERRPNNENKRRPIRRPVRPTFRPRPHPRLSVHPIRRPNRPRNEAGTELNSSSLPKRSDMSSEFDSRYENDDDYYKNHYSETHDDIPLVSPVKSISSDRSINVPGKIFMNIPTVPFNGDAQSVSYSALPLFDHQEQHTQG